MAICECCNHRVKKADLWIIGEWSLCWDCPQWYYENAIHEAAHLIVALACGCDKGFARISMPDDGEEYDEGHLKDNGEPRLWGGEYCVHPAY